ncbi:MAG: hypothetical protein Q4A41_02425, partial [Bacillota bacterium]|nr:hypothetical protein [Bacillota bacterium]
NFTDPDFMELMEKVKNNVLVDQYYYTEDGLQNKIFYGGTVDDFATISNAQSTQMLESVYLNYTVLLPTNNRVRTKPRVISNFAGKYQFGAHGRFAISRKSKNPDLAWRFIEYIASEKEIAPYDPASLTSYKERLEEYTSLFSYSYPINKANFRKYFEVSLDFEDKRIRRAYESQLTCSWEEYRKMVMDYYFSAAEKLNDSTLWSGEFFQPYTRGIIWDEMYLYLNDLQSVEQTMQNIENKIQIMLNE